MSKAVAECIRDQWSDESRRCIATVRDQSDLAACVPRLREQIDHHLKITGIEPNEGDAAGGTYVRIKGNRFTADGPRATQVYIGSRKAEIVRFESDNVIIVEAPGGKAGEIVDVLVLFDPGGRVTLAKAFTFVEKH